jgi:hypothetical protein
MGILLVFGILGLAIFVCISNTVFALVARTQTKRQTLGLQSKK